MPEFQGSTAPDQATPARTQSLEKPLLQPWTLSPAVPLFFLLFHLRGLPSHPSPNLNPFISFQASCAHVFHNYNCRVSYLPLLAFPIQFTFAIVGKDPCVPSRFSLSFFLAFLSPPLRSLLYQKPLFSHCPFSELPGTSETSDLSGRQTFSKMPARTLPTFTRAEVEEHSSDKSCYVTIGDNVYDVTDFVESHPGGPELVLDWAGKDITAILKDPDVHTHSESAYEILVESLVGFVVNEKFATNGHAIEANGVNGDAHVNGNGGANGKWVHPRTGMSCEEDLHKETDFGADYKKHKFLDLNKPLFPQVWYGGFTKDFYLDQIHRPRHYKGGQSAPFFGNFLEPLSKTPWFMVPLIWWPCVSYGIYITAPGFAHLHNFAIFFGLGVCIWSLIEYLLHRFLFHLD